MREHEAIQSGKLRIWKRLLFSLMIQDIALETLITHISLGSLFKRVDIAPHNSRGRDMLRNYSPSFYLESYQNECKLDQFTRNTNDFVVAMMHTNSFL